MAKILIRSSDRRILFFTYDDRVSDVDPLIISIQEKFHNATDLIVTPRPPPNLKLGAYLNATLTDASPEPVEAHGRAFTRRRDFNAWLDAEIAKMNSPAIHGVPSIARDRWYKYLRMLTQIGGQESPFQDTTQWLLIGRALDATPFDFETLDTHQASEFGLTHEEDGLFFTSWWDYATKEQSIRANDPSSPLLSKTGPNYDFRRASLVTMIPESEIDRTDTTIRGADQPWLARANTVRQINAKLPFYER